MPKSNPTRQFLHAGLHSTDEVELYLSLTRIKSDNKIAALHDYLVRGVNISKAAGMNGVDVKDLRDCREQLNKVAVVVDALVDLRLNRGYLTTPK